MAILLFSLNICQIFYVGHYYFMCKKGMMIKKLLIGLCAIQAVKATTWITIKYFSDEACQDDLYGVGVYPAQCIVSGGRGITVSCNSNLGLVVNEYGTITCSDLIQNTSLITSAVTGCHSNINENEYYQQTSSGGSYLVDCMDNDDVSIL